MMYDVREHTSTTGFPNGSIGVRSVVRGNLKRVAFSTAVMLLASGVSSFWLSEYWFVILGLAIAPSALLAHSVISVYKRAPMLLTLHLSAIDFIRYTFSVFPLLTLVGVGGSLAVGVTGWGVMTFGYGLENGLTTATSVVGAIATLTTITGIAGIPIAIFTLRKLKKMRDDFDCSAIITTNFIRNSHIHRN